MQKKDQGKRKPRKPKKFRFQIFANWLIANYPKCKAADIGGGKGLLAYLLNEAGWDVTIIDPEYQDLPLKYTNLDKKKVVLPEGAKVKHINERFSKELAKDFDLLIGLHVHGSCIYMLEASKEYGKDIALLPCCVIDEPIEKMPNINWRESLFEMGKDLGLDIKQEKLGFMGKDIVLFTKNNANLF